MTPQEQLDAIVNAPGAQGIIRRAVLKRLQDLGLTSPVMQSDLIGNAVQPVEYQVYSLEHGTQSPVATVEKLAGMESRGRALKQENLNRVSVRGMTPDDRFPKGAIEHYQQHSEQGRNFSGPPFTGPDGAELGLYQLHQAVLGDLRVVAVAAAREALQLPTAIATAAPAR